MAKVIFITLLFWLPLSVFAQTLTTTFPTRLLTTKDGLPGRECSELFKDSRGFLWISTKGGVCRYDGKNIVAFTKKDGFDHQFHSFTETSNGTIVVRAKGHLMLLNGLNFRRIELPMDATQDISYILTKKGIADSLFVVVSSSNVLQYLYGISMKTSKHKLLENLFFEHSASLNQCRKWQPDIYYFIDL